MTSTQAQALDPKALEAAAKPLSGYVLDVPRMDLTASIIALYLAALPTEAPEPVDGDWLMSVFDMAAIIASSPSRKKFDLARHVLTHVQQVARPATVSSAVPVKVKALEWIERTSPREDGPAEPTGDWDAPGILGAQYAAYFFEDHYEVTREDGEYVESHLGSAEEAKAAAQADYQQRIRGALADA